MQSEIDGADIQQPDHADGDDGGDDDGGKTGEGVGADDQFEGIESARQWGIEGAGDGGGGAAADQQAHVRSADTEHVAEARCHGGADLGVARFQPHRSADAVGKQGLADKGKAGADIHAAAMQGVRLNGVHRWAGPPAEQGPAEQANGETADRGDQHCAQRIEIHGGGNTLPGGKCEQEFMHVLGDDIHQRNDQAGGKADAGGEDDQPHFVRPDERAQGLRGVGNGFVEGTARTGIGPRARAGFGVSCGSVARGSHAPRRSGRRNQNRDLRAASDTRQVRNQARLH